MVFSRSGLAICLSALLASSTFHGISGADQKKPLSDSTKLAYEDLFESAREPQYEPAVIQSERDALKRGQEICIRNLKQNLSEYGKQIEQTQKQLKEKDSKLNDVGRHDLHCKIQNLRAQQKQTAILIQHAIPVAYDNRRAKLDLIEQWPAKYREITNQLEDGSYRNRRWGDVQDIGFRELEKDQEKDIKAGQDAIREMKTNGLMPKEMDNKEVVDFVSRVAQKVAQHSDLKVPLKVTVLDSKEVNAFALPGGFLFIERGLLEAVDDESELAGVIGHEMSHVVARHGHKLMMRATLTGIFLQAAEVAATVMTGGVATVAGYYAFQYGFFGLGLVLDLRLLGVSRDYELEADQLGIQYAWNTGYDPSGFVRFFDKMATTEGYVEGASWFYDHPPFYERMVAAEREMIFLPKKKDLVVQTSDFDKMKHALAKVTTVAQQDEKNRPRLAAPEPGCSNPAKAEYKAGQPIESICGTAPVKPASR